MSSFELYLKLGFTHISDIKAYDHILFIVALCAIYRLRQWRDVLILVTAFTIGHSLTLALATFHVILIKTEIVEFLIPLTILITALLNVSGKAGEAYGRKMRFNYGLALFFGLIHGMGFSNYLRALLGKEESIVGPLFAFNLGLELGQIMIVCLTFVAAFIVLNIFQVKQRDWNIFVSGAAAGIALTLMINTWPW
ncbi:MAG: HupE/UreJ family protein [Bacteroidetes bacterium]|nr:MAG: HupE/UreJ family protein [Bacteroidota bacterium]